VQVARSACPLDCPDRCSLEVRIEDGRVVSLEGSHVNPLTDGFICAKVRNYPARVYGPDRLLRPLRRNGPKGSGSFVPISWSDALDEIAGRIESARRRFGGEAILPFAYGGSNGLVTQGTTDERLFRTLGASRLLRTVCAAQTGAVSEALYGKMPCLDLVEFERARFILIWGANPRASNIHLLPLLKRARDAGARVALVDPRRTLGAGFIDMHLPVLPGSDGAVALAMIGHLGRSARVDRAFLATHATGWERLLERASEWTLERAAARAGVGAQEIAGLAEAYADADPAMLRCGWGVERNRNGEASVAAILALPAVAGKFGKGGGYALSTAEAYRANGERLAGVPEAPVRAINMSQLGRALLEEKAPPISVLFVYDANPAVTLPDQNRVQQGLMRDDLFTVVFDQVLTDTARFADVVLPATTFLEHAEIAGAYGTYGVLLGEAVIPPLGEAKPNAEVFHLLAERLGVDPGPRDDALLSSALAAIEGRFAGDEEPGDVGVRRLARLRSDGILRCEFPGPLPVPFETTFPGTEDRKVHLWPEALGDDPYFIQDDPGGAAYPLALVSPSTDRSICSTLGEVGFTAASVEMHPHDARVRGLAQGQEVRVHNGLGEVRVPMCLNAALRPGVVSLPKGIWTRHTRNGSVASALVPDGLSPVASGACFNDARVEVGPA
jgi:anaerobic selenocysteine-containing dehydrogenase